VIRTFCEGKNRNKTVVKIYTVLPGESIENARKTSFENYSIASVFSLWDVTRQKLPDDPLR